MDMRDRCRSLGKDLVREPSTATSLPVVAVLRARRFRPSLTLKSTTAAGRSA